MQVQSCQSSGMEVSPKTYNACTFEIIDKWDPTQHAKTCDTMFYLRDGTGAYVWDCDKWIFLDFTGYTSPDWKAKEGEAGYIKNKPFETLGNGLIVDENGVLSICVEDNYNLLPNSTWNFGEGNWTFGAGTYYEIVDPEADKPDSHILHAKPSITTTQQIYQAPHPIPVTVGDTITVAFDFKDLNWTKSSNLMVMRIFPERDTPQSQVNSLQNIAWNSNTFGITEETTEFRRLVRSFKVTDSGFLNIIPYNSDNTGNYEQWYREIMVIKGIECEMPDHWYPYYADIPEQIQADWNEKDEDSKAFIKNKPTIPEANILYHEVGEEDDGATTPLSVRKALYADEAASRVQIGNGANATGDLSTAIGSQAKTAKEYSLALGDNATANEKSTVAIGNGAQALHDHSVALGANSTTTRTDTVAVNYGQLNRIIEGVKNPEQPQDAVTKNYGDSNYVSLTEPNHVLGETSFDDVKASSDIDWTNITERQNGFSGGNIQYKRHMDIVTIHGDSIVPPAMAQYSQKTLFYIPAEILSKKNMRVVLDVSKVAMVAHVDSNGQFIVEAGMAITTEMHVSFTMTYVI
ncbi:hypothetical protein VNN36_09245 [Lactococcus garvieae]|uniref:hypothetical protein n=1 Tax=Lactococcus garvieae TaxID=1363 RepID=UPI0030D382CF